MTPPPDFPHEQRYTAIRRPDPQGARVSEGRVLRRVKARQPGATAAKYVLPVGQDGDDGPGRAIIDHLELQGQDAKAASGGLLRMAHADDVHRYARTITGQAGKPAMHHGLASDRASCSASAGLPRQTRTASTCVQSCALACRKSGRLPRSLWAFVFAWSRTSVSPGENADCQE